MSVAMHIYVKYIQVFHLQHEVYVNVAILSFIPVNVYQFALAFRQEQWYRKLGLKQVS